MDVTSWLLFTSVLVNQMGRVLIPAIKTTVIADPVMGSEFKDKVGMFLSGVSIVCLGGKLLGAAVTDKLGGWLILIAVFAIWIVATGGAVVAQSVDVFGYAWLLNSFAYTITWGAVLQVIGATYTNDSEKTAQLTFASSASRFGATIGNIVYGQLLTAGFGWRQVCMPMIPLQALLLLLVIYKWNSATPAAAPKPATPKAGEAPAPPKTSAFGAMLSLDFWLMLIPKMVLFTYTQFFMNYIPQLLHVAYGLDHGLSATLGGVAQGGSVVGLLIVGAYYKKMSKLGQTTLIFCELACCAVAPYLLSLGPSVVPKEIAVPLLVLWGLAYALPFYNPPGEYAMQVGGKTGTALFTNLFDAAGFLMSASWNPWASAIAKTGDFREILLSQAAFGALSMLMMPLCMYRLNAKLEAAKKAQ